jgi:hypothetical protein
MFEEYSSCWWSLRLPISLFEAEEPLNKIARSFKDVKDYSCPDVEAFSALHCFKHGAAFDKMGYYSFLSMYSLLFITKELLPTSTTQYAYVCFLVSSVTELLP